MNVLLNAKEVYLLRKLVSRSTQPLTELSVMDNLVKVLCYWQDESSRFTYEDEEGIV